MWSGPICEQGEFRVVYTVSPKQERNNYTGTLTAVSSGEELRRRHRGKSVMRGRLGGATAQPRSDPSQL